MMVDLAALICIHLSCRVGHSETLAPERRQGCQLVWSTLTHQRHAIAYELHWLAWGA